VSGIAAEAETGTGIVAAAAEVGVGAGIIQGAGAGVEAVIVIVTGDAARRRVDGIKHQLMALRLLHPPLPSPHRLLQSQAASIHPVSSSWAACQV